MSALSSSIHALPPPVAPAAKGRNYLWGLGALVLVFLAGWWLWMRPPTPQSTATTEKTARATTGPLENLLRLNGQTSARNFYTVTAPIMRGAESGGSMVIQKMAKPGTLVRTGDPLVQIDGQTMADHVDDVKD